MFVLMTFYIWIIPSGVSLSPTSLVLVSHSHPIRPVKDLQILSFKAAPFVFTCYIYICFAFWRNRNFFPILFTPFFRLLWNFIFSSVSSSFQWELRSLLETFILLLDQHCQFPCGHHIAAEQCWCIVFLFSLFETLSHFLFDLFLTCGLFKSSYLDSKHMRVFQMPLLFISNLTPLWVQDVHCIY